MTRSQIQNIEEEIMKLRRLIISALPESTPDLLDNTDRDYAGTLCLNINDLQGSLNRIRDILVEKFDLQLMPCDHKGLCSHIEHDEYGKEAIVKKLINCDKMSEGDARQLIAEFEEDLKEYSESTEHISFDEIYETFKEYFGLEPDYLMPFLEDYLK